MAPGEITELLAQAREGDPKALDRLIPLVYRELHAMARARLFHGGRDATLNTTALVHEAYIKLFDQARLNLADRRHFFAVAALTMRQIVVDHARRKASLKRGAGERPAQLTTGIAAPGDDRWDDVLSLEEALKQLALLEPRLAQIVELRFFAGLSVEEVAEIIGRDARTVRRDWRKAKALLQHTLRDGDAGEPK